MPDHRLQTTLRLSPQARQGWDDAADRCGVDLTALMEAAGQLLLEKPGKYPPADVVERAKQIARERRRRRVLVDGDGALA